MKNLITGISLLTIISILLIWDIANTFTSMLGMNTYKQVMPMNMTIPGNSFITNTVYPTPTAQPNYTTVYQPVQVTPERNYQNYGEEQHDRQSTQDTSSVQDIRSQQNTASTFIPTPTPQNYCWDYGTLQYGGGEFSEYSYRVPC